MRTYLTLIVVIFSVLFMSINYLSVYLYTYRVLFIILASIVIEGFQISDRRFTHVTYVSHGNPEVTILQS